MNALQMFGRVDARTREGLVSLVSSTEGNRDAHGARG